MTMEHVVIQLQQELFSLRAQVAAQVQIAAAVQAIDNLATAQDRKDTPSLIDVNGLGCLKEFSGKEDDVQWWSKKTGAFFAGVVKESGTMLEWAAEQMTEITAKLIGREFLLTATNQERGVQNLGFVLQQMHTALVALTNCEANDIVANSRKNPLEAWRRLKKNTILQEEEGRETFYARSFLRDDALVWNSKRDLNSGCDTCRATRRSKRTRWMSWCRRSSRSI